MEEEHTLIVNESMSDNSDIKEFLDLSASNDFVIKILSETKLEACFLSILQSSTPVYTSSWTQSVKELKLYEFMRIAGVNFRFM